MGWETGKRGDLNWKLIDQEMRAALQSQDDLVDWKECQADWDAQDVGSVP